MKTCQHPECTYNVLSHNFCGYHQNDRTDQKWLDTIEKRKQKHKGYVQRGTKRQMDRYTQNKTTIVKSKKKPTGEYALFLAIWGVRKHVSFISNELLAYTPHNAFWVNCFAHVLSKKQYPISVC